MLSRQVQAAWELQAPARRIEPCADGHAGHAPRRRYHYLHIAPLLSGCDAVKVFGAFGWRAVRQNGSHIVLVKEGHSATLPVPDHKEVARGILRSLIRDAELTVGEFVSAI